MIAAAKAEAQKLQAPGGVIAVVDDGGNLMALERLDTTFSAGANISIGKARTAVMFADRYEGKRLNSPNDLVYKSDGALYFTDTPFGLPRSESQPVYAVLARVACGMVRVL